MLIQVVYSDRKIGLVDQGKLDRLIESGSIAAFRRLDAWAIIGKDQTRKDCRIYGGPERRGRGGIADECPRDYEHPGLSQGTAFK